MNWNASWYTHMAIENIIKDMPATPNVGGRLSARRAQPVKNNDRKIMIEKQRSKNNDRKTAIEKQNIDRKIYIAKY